MTQCIHCGWQVFCAAVSGRTCDGVVLSHPERNPCHTNGQSTVLVYLKLHCPLEIFPDQNGLLVDFHQVLIPYMQWLFYVHIKHLYCCSSLSTGICWDEFGFAGGPC